MSYLAMYWPLMVLNIFYTWELSASSMLRFLLWPLAFWVSFFCNISTCRLWIGIPVEHSTVHLPFICALLWERLGGRRGQLVVCEGRMCYALYFGLRPAVNALVGAFDGNSLRFLLDCHETCSLDLVVFSSLCFLSCLLRFCVISIWAVIAVWGGCRQQTSKSILDSLLWNWSSTLVCKSRLVVLCRLRFLYLCACSLYIFRWWPLLLFCWDHDLFLQRKV